MATNSKLSAREDQMLDLDEALRRMKIDIGFYAQHLRHRVEEHLEGQVVRVKLQALERALGDVSPWLRDVQQAWAHRQRQPNRTNELRDRQYRGQRAAESLKAIHKQALRKRKSKG